MMSFLRAGLVLFALLCVSAAPVRAAELPVLRIGVLQFGTVSWELEVMQRGGFAEREGVRIEVVPLPTPDGVNDCNSLLPLKT